VPTKWEQLKATQRMQDYIEANLLAPITLTALAKCARYSPWYAARIFKECTGKTPFDYVRQRRLFEAALRIHSESTPIITVAFDFVFDSHDGFTRAFTKQFGMTPQQFRKEKPTFRRHVPRASRNYFRERQLGESMKSNEKSNTVFVQVIERPARKLILMRGRKANHYFEYCEEVGCDVWEVLGAIEPALHEPMGLWLPVALRKPDTSVYVQGVEVPLDFTGKIPPGYEILDVPPCKMMIFQGPPFEEKDYSQAIESLWDCINEYKPETFGFVWADEDAPRFQLAPMGYRGYIEGRPVRAVSRSI
jgi:AraC-like DNA-binding protein